MSLTLKLSEQLTFPFWSEDSATIIQSPLTRAAYSREFLRDVLSPSGKNEATQLLRQLIDQDEDLIFIKDREGRFALVNNAVARVYGASIEEIVGKYDCDFNTSRAEVEHFQRYDRAVLESGRESVIPFELISTADGGRKALRTVKIPLIDETGAPTHLLGISTDISLRTESKLLERTLKTLSKQLSGNSNSFDHSSLDTAMVLVVDDDEAVREVTREILEGAGYRVSVARDGLEGIEQLRSQSEAIRLVILDLVMPRADGEEMLRQMKKLLPEVPVIICTGYVPASQKLPTMEHILAKPYDPRQLLAYAEHLIVRK